MSDEEESATYFRSAGEFREWLESHHQEADELWVGYFKKGTGEDTMTWSESVDQALCFGWIDGLRKRVDDRRYKIRFTPRRSGSIWSAVNLRKMEQLEEAGLMTDAGRAVFSRRTEERSRVYAYERETAELASEFLAQLEADAEAWKFWQSLGSYNAKAMTHWVMSAKRESTRRRRFVQLLENSKQGQLIPSLRR